MGWAQTIDIGKNRIVPLLLLPSPLRYFDFTFFYHFMLTGLFSITCVNRPITISETLLALIALVSENR